MQKPTSTDPEDLTFGNSNSTLTRKHSWSSLLLTISVILQWLAIAAMCCLIFFYMDVLKEDINVGLRGKMENITSNNFQTIGSDTFKSSVVKSEKPIAHFTALADFQNTSGRLFFEHTKGHAFKTADMKYNAAGYLVIPTNGIYFIYAQVTFKCLQDCSKLIQQFFVSIFKKNNHYQDPEVLLKSYVRPQAKGDDFLKISTYQGGAFKLYADDHMYVEVPKNSRISVHEQETYFGAFLLEPSASE
ncbi:tumor necrosis factor ligand superfamily member 15-like [Chiloscyllium plagiosum]|uniref:tumor necrosis factor ligand superfamily member 15-like n=1 Tax=Chiloscyllium plagiosum TaxID=36176 RepID=UPI001CB83F06|nr:tumor necrosis factor ligand superfamily member 15-like [Chiloscyllium plagiosum]